MGSARQQIRARGLVLGVVIGMFAALAPVAATVEPVGAVPAPTTERVSVTSDGIEGDIGFNPNVSEDGRFVSFNAILPGHNTAAYVRDRESGTTELVSVDGGTTYLSSENSMSRDGRFVAFSALGGLGLRDRIAGTTEVVSLTNAGAQTSGNSPALSDDARYVGFASSATNVVAGDTNGVTDTFVRDRVAGTTERISVSSAGLQADGFSGTPVISGDGRYVAFISAASNLVTGDDNSAEDVFLRDRLSGTTERVGLGCVGSCSFGGIESLAMSRDGRYITFSTAAALVPEDTNGVFGQDLYLHDRDTDTTELVSVTASGAAAGSDGSGRISDDGRKIVFDSHSPDIVPGDTNGASDVFVRDRVSHTTERVSVSTAGAEQHPLSSSSTGESTSAISSDGSVVAFNSNAGDLVTGDTNLDDDVFVRALPDAPVPAIVTPPNRAYYEVGQSVTASFSCAPGSSAVVSCVGSTPNGAPLDTSTPGTFTYDVTGTDAAGHVGTAATEYTVIESEAVSDSVGGGGSVSTDPGAEGATELAPLETTVVTPNAGTVSVSAGPVTTPTPSGYTLFGLQLQISAPPATASAPLTFVFDVDSTIVRLVDTSAVTFIKDGVLVPDCLGEVAVPDGLTACVSGRDSSPLDPEDLRLAIISTSASTWNLVAGAPVPPTMTAAPASTTEANAGTHTVAVPVSLSAPSAVTVSAAWTTQNQTATGGSDYIVASGTVTFAPGQTSKPVLVTVKGDTTVEPNEAFRVAFSSPSNATIGGTGFGVVTILNDDATLAGFHVTTASLPNAHLGTSYAATLAATGGTVPYKWKKLTTLPTGLKLTAKTGVISGTPKRVRGTFRVTVQVTDSRKPKPKRIASKTFTITVN